MPTLNEYKNDPGFYIRAWTSELGNFNYKVKPPGWKIIRQSTILEDGEDIAWKWVDALKALGVIYTDDSGIILPGDDKFQPDPDRLDDVTLTEKEARQFLETILTNEDLSHEELLTLCDILGIDPPDEFVDLRFEPAADNIAADIGASIDDIPLTETLTHTEDGRRIQADISIGTFVTGPESAEGREEEDGWDEAIEKNSIGLVLGLDRELDGPISDHILHIAHFDSDGITHWHGLYPGELTWEVRGELYSQMGRILPI